MHSTDCAQSFGEFSGLQEHQCCGPDLGGGCALGHYPYPIAGFGRHRLLTPWVQQMTALNPFS